MSVRKIEKALMEYTYEGVWHRRKVQGKDMDCIKRVEDLTEIINITEQKKELPPGVYGREWCEKVYAYSKGKFRRATSVREALKEGAEAIIIYYHEYDFFRSKPDWRFLKYYINL